MQTALDKTWGKNKSGNDEGVDELVTTLSRLSCGARETAIDDDLGDALASLNISPGQKPSQESLNKAMAWVSFEDDDDFITATRLDVQDELLEGVIENEDDADDDLGSTGCGPDESAIVPAPAPYAEVAEMFGDLEARAETSDMQDVSYHLRKAKMAWMRAYGSTKARQGNIRDFFHS